MNNCCICNDKAEKTIHVYDKAYHKTDYYFCVECRIKLDELEIIYMADFMNFVLKERRKKKLAKLLS